MDGVSPRANDDNLSSKPRETSGRSAKTRKKSHVLPQSSRLERKRALDREAQKAHRERNKAYIAHLESLVEALQTSDDSDSRTNELVMQLEQSRTAIKALQETMTSITRLASGFISDQSSTQEAVSTSRCCCSKNSTTTANTTDTDTSTDTVCSQLDIPDMDAWTENGLTDVAHAIPNIALADFSMHESTRMSASSKDTDTEVTPNTASNTLSTAYTIPWTSELLAGTLLCNSMSGGNRPSIGHLGTVIMSAPQLDGKRWYLAGALLNHILNSKERAEMLTWNDEDIAIRAVVEGWTEVQTQYPLDIGWQWLKVVDENLWLGIGKPERLQSLRNCRILLLHQMNPQAGYDKRLPAFFAPRPSQKFLRNDPLIEHFPWPAFRDRLLFGSQKYVSDKFMDNFCKHMHVLWPFNDSELYVQDEMTGLYSYSAAFEQCTNDIRRYTCRPDLFQQFPELLADIPQDCPSPYSMISSAMDTQVHDSTKEVIVAHL
jgi:hypothetical protein